MINFKILYFEADGRVRFEAVSYTHLDVYKRQDCSPAAEDKQPYQRRLSTLK